MKAEIESTAFTPVGSPVLPAPPEWLRTSTSDNDYWLPSLNVATDLTDNVILRFAAAKVVSWPAYNEMANNTFLNDTTLIGSGGNPDLEPYDALEPAPRFWSLHGRRLLRLQYPTSP